MSYMKLFSELREAITSWSGSVFGPCRAAILCFLKEENLIEIETFEIETEDLDMDPEMLDNLKPNTKLWYEWIRKTWLDRRFRGHHFSGDVGYSIAKKLVELRGAVYDLITTDEYRCEGVKGRYDCASYPCEHYRKCRKKRGWESCINCEERVGSLPILVEVGTITDFYKLLAPDAYEVWLVKPDIEKLKCFVFRGKNIAKAEKTIGEIFSGIYVTEDCPVAKNLGVECTVWTKCPNLYQKPKKPENPTSKKFLDFCERVKNGESSGLS